MALRLIGMGYGKVFALKGGWDEWVRLGYPVARTAGDAGAMPGKAGETEK